MITLEATLPNVAMVTMAIRMYTMMEPCLHCVSVFLREFIISVVEVSDTI